MKPHCVFDKNNKNTAIKTKAIIKMRYNDRTMNPALQGEEVIPSLNEVEESIDDSGKNIKAHVIRRNVEDYLERKSLERSLKEVFDDDYMLD